MEISSPFSNDSGQCTQSAFVEAAAAVASSLTKLTPDDVNNSGETAAKRAANVNTYLAVEAMTTTPPSINTSSILKNSSAFNKNSNFLFYFSNQYQQSTKNNKENNEDAVSIDSISSSSASSSCLSFSNFNPNNRSKPSNTSQFSHHYHQTTTSNQQYVSTTNAVTSTNSTITTTINPFEESNRHRLEQSVLSPNLFHVASTSTPERDTNCLWNIDQRAVLYPADIPTDESSLVAQYVHDQKLNRQLSAAVETFWSQNQIIIESPLAGAASGSQFGGSSSSGSGYGPLRNRLNAAGSNQSSAKSNNFKASFNVNSPLASNSATPLSNKTRNNPSSNSNNATNSNARNNHLNRFKQQHQVSQQQSTFSQQKSHLLNKQSAKDSNDFQSPPSSSSKQSKIHKQSNRDSKYCQTVLSIPTDFDLNQIPELKQFLSYDDENACDDSPDSNNREANMKEVTLNNSIRKKLFDHQSSEDHPTLTTMATSYAAVVVETNRLVDDKGGQLPKSDFLPSSSTWSDIEMATSSKLRSMKASTSSNWQEDSLEFQDDDQQFASSPKSCRRYSNIIHDIGDDEEVFFGTDTAEDLDDSVFYSQRQPDFDLLKEKRAETQDDAAALSVGATAKSVHKDQLDGGARKNRKVRIIQSPNLSPIQLEREGQDTSSCKNGTYKTSRHDRSQTSRSSKQKSANPNSVVTVADASKAEVVNPKAGKKEKMSHNRKQNADINRVPSSEQLKQSSTRQKKISSQKSIGFTSSSAISTMKSTSSSSSSMSSLGNRSHHQNLKFADQSSSALINSNGHIVASSMIETTTNTFNQDSQDTGYITNFANGSSSNCNNSAQSYSNPSMLNMDVTNQNSFFVNETNSGAAIVGSAFQAVNLLSFIEGSSKSARNSSTIVNSYQQIGEPAQSRDKNGVTSTPKNVEYDDSQYFVKQNSSEIASTSRVENLSSTVCKNASDSLLVPVEGKLLLPKPIESKNLTKSSTNKSKTNKADSLKKVASLSSVRAKEKQSLVNLNESQNINSSANLPKSANASMNKSKFNNSSSISMNSLEHICPVECSTPEILKSSKLRTSSKSTGKHLDSTSTHDPLKTSLMESKTRSILPNQSILSNSRSSDRIQALSESMRALSFTKSNLDVSQNNDDKRTKPISRVEFGLYSNMDESILRSKLSPSKYAHYVIQKARKDLNDSINLL